MSNETKVGSDWQDDELGTIVADYFDMLAADLARQPYSKTEHNKALGRLIGRPHGSIEFKHQNISAVLEELGMPWIPGYKPRRNYQNAIFDAIDRYLSERPPMLELVSTAPSPAVATSGIFVTRPHLIAPTSDPVPERLSRLIKKYDPVDRDYRNRLLGRSGEAFVMEVERQTLLEAGRDDLARRVRWVAADDGDGAGYDVLSYAADNGRERLIEVKTTNGSARTPFYLSRNERSVADERPADWCIYLVHCFALTPRIFSILPPIELSVRLCPEVWRATF